MVKVVTKTYVLGANDKAQLIRTEVESYDVDGADALALVFDTNTRETSDENYEADWEGNIVYLKSSYATLV